MVALVGLAAAGLADGTTSSTANYTVVPGDSLWSIATANGLTVAQLASANGIDPSAILPIGKVLVLPGSGYEASRATEAPSGDPFDFCAGFVAERGPWGQLPAGLAGTSAYEQLEPIFAEWAAHYGISLPLLEAVDWQESGWQQSVVSPTGAVGIGQIEPYTATFIEQEIVGEPLDIHSVSDNIRMSAAYLGFLADAEGDNACATVAAYYEGAVNLQTYGVLPEARQYIEDVEYLESEFQ